jgi:hypothetical protein
MHIDAEEITKINESLKAIDGWEIQDFKVWETTSGTGMATIRLRKSTTVSSEEEDDCEPDIGIPGGGMAMDINIVRKHND